MTANLLETSRRTRRATSLLPIALAVALISAACGGSTDDASSESTQPPEVGSSVDIALGSSTTGEPSPSDSIPENSADDAADSVPDPVPDNAADPVPENAADPVPENAADPVPEEAAPSSAAPGTDAVEGTDAPEWGRVVALAEEFLLADLLALGITPVASTATVDAVGFQGLDDVDTSGIEVLPQTTLSLEYLASLRPDTIVTLQFWVDQVGPGVLDGIAELVVIPDGLEGADQIEALGDLLGRSERAAAVATELNEAAADAREAVGEGCTLSLATVYPGPAVAAFVDGPWQIPTAIQDVGCEIVPGPDVAAPDANGRAWLSKEQLGLLNQEVLVLLQNDSVDGEQDALAEIQSSPLWATLPAVLGDGVIVVDRLGYPGAAGLIRFYDEIPSLLGS